MHKHWLVLLLMLISLCKCSGPAEEAEPAETIVDLKPTESVGFSASLRVLETPVSDAVTGWVLDTDSALGIRLMGKDILLFSGYGCTKLTLYSGSDLSVSAETILPCTVYPDDPTVQVNEAGITYLDHRTRELVSLDATLEEKHRIPLPADAEIGVLSRNHDFFYYCTPDALYALDLQTGLVRLVREMACPWQEVYALHCNDTVIQCTTVLDDFPHSLFLSTQTGELLYECSGTTELWTEGDLYFTIHPDGTYQELISGSQHFGPSILESHADYIHIEPILPQKSVLLYRKVDDDLILDYYRLDTGIHEYQAILPSQYYPSGMEAAPNGNTIWFLAFDPQIQSDVLFVWDLECSRAKDSVCYLQDRWTSQNPDLAGLEQCAALAADLSSKYGIQILIGEDTVTFSPDHYSFLPEHQVPVILKQLEELDHALSLYPQDFLSQLAPSGQSVTICLVRKISGSTDSNGLESPVGLQFWDSATTPYIAIASGADTAQNIHHEIFHIIDSRVLSTCNAYDNWDGLNPPDFSYDYDYASNLRRDDWEWVIGENPYFIDLYAMSFPKEDRARIMEYAMTAGAASAFSTPALQAKLHQLCIGIREAFYFEYTAAPLPWEQYLLVSPASHT